MNLSIHITRPRVATVDWEHVTRNSGVYGCLSGPPEWRYVSINSGDGCQTVFVATSEKLFVPDSYAENGRYYLTGEKLELVWHKED